MPEYLGLDTDTGWAQFSERISSTLNFLTRTILSEKNCLSPENLEDVRNEVWMFLFEERLKIEEKYDPEKSQIQTFVSGWIKRRVLTYIAKELRWKNPSLLQVVDGKTGDSYPNVDDRSHISPEDFSQSSFLIFDLLADEYEEGLTGREKIVFQIFRERTKCRNALEEYARMKNIPINTLKKLHPKVKEGFRTFCQQHWEAKRQWFFGRMSNG